MTNDRGRAEDAVRLLNTLDGDLLSARGSYSIFEDIFVRQGSSEQLVRVTLRMHLSYIALALCKLRELWQRYGDIFPGDCREPFERIVETIEERNVVKFRNKFVGHIWDFKTDRPVPGSEVDRFYDDLVGEDVHEFLNWVNTPNDYTFPNTVVSIVETTRRALIDEYDIVL